jgi:hypothetical protein
MYNSSVERTGTTMIDLYSSDHFECSDVVNLAVFAKAFTHEYRFTILMVITTVLNMVLHRVNSSIKKMHSYRYLTPQVSQELGARCMQLLFGIFIAGTGYATLAFNNATGCHANDIFTYWLGGIWLVCFDAHEYVYRWPLPPNQLRHHLGVIVFALAVIEWKVGAKSKEHTPSLFVLLTANIGSIWVSDIFHVIYRTSDNLKRIIACRKLYLQLSVFRFANVFLFFSVVESMARNGFYSGAVALCPLAFVYVHNSMKSVQFVYSFDCGKYYSEHQAAWTKGPKQLL